MSSTTPSTDKTTATTPSVEENSTTSPVESSVEEETFKVYVGNLSLKSTNESIKAFFNEVGKVVEPIIIRRKYKPFRNCFGFIGYSSLAEAEKAVEELNQKELDGRKLHVQMARPKEPKENTVDESSSKESSQQNSEEENLNTTTTTEKKIKKKSNKKSRKTKKNDHKDETVKENEKEETVTEKEAKAVKENDKEKVEKMDEKKKGDQESTPTIDPVSSIETSEQVPPEPKPKSTVFVANLPRKLKVDGLKDVFKEYQVESAIIAIQKNGRSKGYGFVELKTVDEMQKVLTEFVNFELDGRPIHISAATSVKNTEDKRADRKYKKKPRRKSRQQQQSEGEENEEQEKPKRTRKFKRRYSNKKRLGSNHLNEKENEGVEAAKEAQEAVKELKKEDAVEAANEAVKKSQKEDDVEATK
ncbi:uncharacterized protein BX663DRAFT_559395 [Cokeromyces recurvatus]|uniref:uncharacterized protein n=1 Tax=Cokeromyces recurvatus TaxID=90255 RepID=UPI00222127E8|nr:uncharacterized protein BX663DRAFT_559395 [Cokeromyces recurvatus]KAI7905194.1 hypothetical protein BX663DRAFT_559395 [Cokeromyces recurvatus]